MVDDIRPAWIPLLVAVLVAGCEAEPSHPTPGAESVTAPGLSALAATTLPSPIVVEAEEGLQTPESAVHDAAEDVYIVSNVNGHPQALTNDGFISRITTDGEVDELRWIEGGENGVTLHAPTGIILDGDILYVADADAVRLFHRESGVPLGSWEVPVDVEDGVVQNVLLNDVCVGPPGVVYLTGTGIEITPEFDIVPTGADAVYRFEDGEPVILAEAADLEGPNGCVVVGANVFVVPLLGTESYRLNSSGRIFPVAELPVGGLDGLVRSGGLLYVSSVFEGKIMRMTIGGSEVTTLLEGLVSPADLGYDALRHRLLIPSLFGDTFTIQPVG